MKVIKSKGVKKSARDVIAGIKKLFGSFPDLNKYIELMNKVKNKLPNKMNIVSNKIKIIKKGFTMRMSVK